MRERERERERDRESRRDKRDTGRITRAYEREEEEGWTRVTSRKIGERYVRAREEPRRSYTGYSPESIYKPTPSNWRDRSGISSFYFTRFPEEMTEKDLWGHFREWGHVQEVFISKHRNKGGRKYGFVRFSGVTDVRRLERQLDNLIISGMKLYVNVPKYERRKSSSEESKTAPKLRSAGGQQANVANRAPRQQPMQHGTLQSGLSYKKALIPTAKTPKQRQGP